MFKLVAIIIAAFALMRIWQIYAREKTERETKQRYIARRLKEIEERDSDEEERENKKSSDGEN